MMVRFLLPCTTGADPDAIAVAVELAHSCGASLVSLSLQDALKIENVEAPRPSKSDFLEIVQHQAACMEVPIEWFAISTHDAGRSIHVFAEEMDCTGILLFVREEQGILLETSEVRYVIKHEHIILPFLVHLLPKESSPSILSWSQRKKMSVTPQRKRAFPLWYPFALLALILIVAALAFLNGMYLLKEPVFTLASLLIKLIFVFVVTLSLTAILTFSVEIWRKKQK